MGHHYNGSAVVTFVKFQDFCHLDYLLSFGKREEEYLYISFADNTLNLQENSQIPAQSEPCSHQSRNTITHDGMNHVTGSLSNTTEYRARGYLREPGRHGFFSHARFHSSGEVERLLKKAGFEIEEIDSSAGFAVILARKSQRIVP
jgi:hypothetical protein